jgi:alpha-beta hydrolase superfamily lysophospholipase
VALLASFEQLFGSERVALLREVALVPRDLATVVPEPRAGGDVVILVHGFFASAGVFRPLRARLERRGVQVATFTHAPGARIARIARRLAAVVDRVAPDARVTLVGHSIGGIVARYYVQEMGGRARVAQTVSLGAPFGGVDVPRLLVGADIHQESALLARLRSSAAACGVPHTSIVGAEDTVAGVESAMLGFGDVVVVPRRGHNALLFCERVGSLVLERVERAAAPLPPGRRVVG